MATFTKAFVTGSTGLLGNNLVRVLTERGVRVAALARSRSKAARRFAGLNVDVVEGDRPRSRNSRVRFKAPRC